MIKIAFILLFIPFFLHGQLKIMDEPGQGKNHFTIMSNASSSSIYYNPNEELLISKSAAFLADDVEKVTGKKPDILTSPDALKGRIIMVGTIGNNPLIDKLIANKKLNVAEIKGEWERFIIQTIDKPFPNVAEALVIVGSDRRGAAYGVFTLSEKMGVSPWYWWADAPVKMKNNIFLEKGRFVSKAPSVKYRGIFLNDEAPALRGWAQETFGGFNHQFYEKVFELILRNKGNYLWPAMWRPAAFADDDPENLKMADAYGIVMSTSHHEPMMRAHDEWSRFDGGAWNYNTNREKLQEFWRGGIVRNGEYESVVTLGMRGDGDEAMTEETAVDLLQTIITDQRKIIEEVTGRPAPETPQVWAVYKEVQDYYDKGMRVDDDIIILFCDDNWGNIRILPKKEDLDREGGFGIYYHFDFVGGPVSYRWLNVTQIERVWEQMNLAFEWGVKDLWIVNVGDLKPMELPISFFLDFAWDTDMDAADLPEYYLKWADQQFGDAYAEEIADILRLYTKYNARRTPEMLKPETYSLTNYREAERIVEEYRSLVKKSRKIYDALPVTHRSAFYQLVLSPVELCSNLNEMYVAAAKNKLYAQQGRASTNHYADKAKEAFMRDAGLTKYFHQDLEEGKWNHMMAQTHIGYTSWNNPPFNKMPEVTYIHPQPTPELGYVIEHGEESRWSKGGLFSSSFPPFDPFNDQEYYVEIFNRGEGKLGYSVVPQEDWIKVSRTEGSIFHEEKVYVSIDWSSIPDNSIGGSIVISSEGSREFTIEVPVEHNQEIKPAGFIENQGFISIEAANYSRKHETKDISWTEIPNMGRTFSSITVEPSNAARQTPGPNSPSLEYKFTLFDTSSVNVNTYLSPTLNYKKNEGLKFAIAIDDRAPQIINMHTGENQPDWEYPAWWNNSVTDHIKIKTSEHGEISPGVHTLKVWMIDPGVVFQKFVIDCGGLKNSYLGPPESVQIKNNEDDSGSK